MNQIECKFIHSYEVISNYPASVPDKTWQMFAYLNNRWRRVFYFSLFYLIAYNPMKLLTRRFVYKFLIDNNWKFFS